MIEIAGGGFVSVLRFDSVIAGVVVLVHNFLLGGCSLWFEVAFLFNNLAAVSVSNERFHMSQSQREK